MAITDIGLLSASRLRVKYRVTAEASGGSDAVANVTLVADTLPGPLRDLLAATYADLAALLEATTNSPAVSLYIRSTTAQPVLAGVELAFAAGKAILVIAVAAAAGATVADVELVYNHPLVQ